MPGFCLPSHLPLLKLKRLCQCADSGGWHRSIIRLENALWRRFRVSSKGAAKDEAPHRPSTMLVFYCIPVLPGKSRILARFPRNFLRFVNLPRWIAHLNSIVFTDGDNSFLHMQVRVPYLCVLLSCIALPCCV